MIHEEIQHHFAQLVLYGRWEVVKETKQVLETDKLTEVLGSSHDLN